MMENSISRLVLCCLLCLVAANNVHATITISDETPPGICPHGEFVSTLKCSGKYCDELSYTCAPLSNAEIGTSYWTELVSEENKDARQCEANSFISGLYCTGDYCDNLSLQCTYIENVKSQRNCQLGPRISDENSDIEVIADTVGGIASGLKCVGKYCDDKQFQSCDVIIEKPISISGIASYGRRALVNTEIELLPIDFLTSGGSIKSKIQRTVTDSAGSFKFDNLQRVLGKAAAIPFMLRAKVNSGYNNSASDKRYLYSISIQRNSSQNFVNINQFTDVITDTFTMTMSSMFSPGASQCWDNIECVDLAARSIKREPNVVQNIEKGFINIFSKLVDINSSILTADYRENSNASKINELLGLVQVKLINQRLELDLLSGGNLVRVPIDTMSSAEYSLNSQQVALIKDEACKFENSSICLSASNSEITTQKSNPSNSLFCHSQEKDFCRAYQAADEGQLEGFRQICISNGYAITESCPDDFNGYCEETFMDYEQEVMYSEVEYYYRDRKPPLSGVTAGMCSVTN